MSIIGTNYVGIGISEICQSNILRQIIDALSKKTPYFMLIIKNDSQKQIDQLKQKGVIFSQ